MSEGPATGRRVSERLRVAVHRHATVSVADFGLRRLGGNAGGQAVGDVTVAEIVEAEPGEPGSLHHPFQGGAKVTEEPSSGNPLLALPEERSGLWGQQDEERVRVLGLTAREPADGGVRVNADLDVSQGEEVAGAEAVASVQDDQQGLAQAPGRQVVQESDPGVGALQGTEAEVEQHRPPVLQEGVGGQDPLLLRCPAPGGVELGIEEEVDDLQRAQVAGPPGVELGLERRHERLLNLDARWYPLHSVSFFRPPGRVRYAYRKDTLRRSIFTPRIGHHRETLPSAGHAPCVVAERRRGPGVAELGAHVIDRRARSQEERG